MMGKHSDCFKLRFKAPMRYATPSPLRMHAPACLGPSRPAPAHTSGRGRPLARAPTRTCCPLRCACPRQPNRSSVHQRAALPPSPSPRYLTNSLSLSQITLFIGACSTQPTSSQARRYRHRRVAIPPACSTSPPDSSPVQRYSCLSLPPIPPSPPSLLLTPAPLFLSPSLPLSPPLPHSHSPSLSANLCQ